MSADVMVSIELLDRSYQLKTSPTEAKKLREAGAYLNNKMEEINENGTTIGYEKTAVLAALDMSFQLMKLREKEDISKNDLLQQLQEIDTKVSSVIADKDFATPKAPLGEQQTLEL